jgi:hypothetical protein
MVSLCSVRTRATSPGLFSLPSVECVKNQKNTSCCLSGRKNGFCSLSSHMVLTVSKTFRFHNKLCADGNVPAPKGY